MANPPPQDDDPLPVQPPAKKNPAQLAKKLRTRIDELKLEFPAVPTLTGTPNKLGELGQAAGSATVTLDLVTSLDLAQKLFLLEKANLRPSLEAAAAASAPASGEMPALILTGGTLAQSHHAGVHFDQVEFRSPPIAAVYSAGTSYSEVESKLQRQCVTASTAAVGMPGIFQVDASYNTASSRAAHDQQIRIFVQASRIVSKAEIVFVQDRLSLAPEVIREIEKACGPGTVAEQAGRLLAQLERYGHFVPTSIIMGGRLTLYTSEILKDHSEFESVSNELRVAAKARFESGKGAGDTGVKTGQEAFAHTAEQEGELYSEAKGGDTSLANSQITNFGTLWQTTVGPYHSWDTIGYGGRSLLPTIALLPDLLAKKCTDILRKYFVSQLVNQRSEYAGTEQDTPYGDNFGTTGSQRARFAGIKVNHGLNIDGLEWWYELGDGSIHEVGRWIGRHNGDREDPIPLAKDEELIAIEAGVRDERIQQLAFVTSKKRYPGESGYYGRNRADTFTTITAPRVIGLFGWKGDPIYSIGIVFRMLANNAKSRDFLLAMEPFLFPDHVYDQA